MSTVTGFAIEDGIPIPTLGRKPRSKDTRPRFRFAEMQPGQSFAVPYAGEIERRYWQFTLMESLRGLRRWSNGRFLWRTLDDHIRVWRVE